jgi:uncharacterized membrane protein YgcG
MHALNIFFWTFFGVCVAYVAWGAFSVLRDLLRHRVRAAPGPRGVVGSGLSSVDTVDTHATFGGSESSCDLQASEAAGGDSGGSDSSGGDFSGGGGESGGGGASGGW